MIALLDLKKKKKKKSVRARNQIDGPVSAQLHYIQIVKGTLDSFSRRVFTRLDAVITVAPSSSNHKAMMGHLAKADVPVPQKIKEFRVTKDVLFRRVISRKSRIS